MMFNLLDSFKTSMYRQFQHKLNHSTICKSVEISEISLALLQKSFNLFVFPKEVTYYVFAICFQPLLHE